MTLHVRGISTRPPAPVSPKLDAARIKKGKPPITKDYAQRLSLDRAFLARPPL